MALPFYLALYCGVLGLMAMAPEAVTILKILLLSQKQQNPTLE